ncbi:MAG: bile acid:sodium symporter family protein [Bacteroidetes bacterium]|jgi:bile acid:Na+ symporter, BASS family|nr:bile acid:sodium symporter family protein [Bacteroidota bacterium]MBT5527534.1 bile acid:sodium symporter family protein [Cytophagia bacterium]MBT3801337.1 bile acid:sodium symporter family protein [Bacteroidota bacterium]MBT4338561.1 bile acid:sodium symporter family protein [Bacteroidota bacterium]MBT4729208.1 bile acid:sodium symporter family protein [Bacteroidota bacterium]
MFETLQQLDTIRLNFDPGGLMVLNVTLAFIMFGVALEIKPENFKNIFKSPKSAIVGIVSQFVLLPLVTFLVAVLLHKWITPTVALGMILVAACPGGNISNFISSLAKGNIALSVSLTAFATVASLFLTPINFMFYGRMYTRFLSSIGTDLVRPLDIPLNQVFITVFLILGLPVLLGILFKWKMPKLTLKIVKPIKIFSILFFSAIVIVSFMNNKTHFVTYIKYVFIIVLIHNFFALTTGYTIASIFKLPKLDRRSITIETGIQNSGLGLVLLFNEKIFPPELAVGGMAFITAWWGIWHILAGLTIAFFWSRAKIN